MTTDSTTEIAQRRRPHGRYPKTQDGATPKHIGKLSEYMEAEEVNAIIRCVEQAQHGQAGRELSVLPTFLASAHRSPSTQMTTSMLSAPSDRQRLT